MVCMTVMITQMKIIVRATNIQQQYVCMMSFFQMTFLVFPL